MGPIYTVFRSTDIFLHIASFECSCEENASYREIKELVLPLILATGKIFAKNPESVCQIVADVGQLYLHKLFDLYARALNRSEERVSGKVFGDFHNFMGLKSIQGKNVEQTIEAVNTMARLIAQEMGIRISGEPLVSFCTFMRSGEFQSWAISRRVIGCTIAIFDRPPQFLENFSGLEELTLRVRNFEEHMPKISSLKKIHLQSCDDPKLLISRFVEQYPHLDNLHLESDQSKGMVAVDRRGKLSRLSLRNFKIEKFPNLQDDDYKESFQLIFSQKILNLSSVLKARELDSKQFRLVETPDTCYVTKL